MSNYDLSYMVVLNLPTKDGDLTTYAQSVYNHLLNNVTYPNPSPTLAVFADDIAAFATAAAKAAGKDRVLIAARRAARKKVKSDLFQLRNYVQSVIDASATPDTAAAMIESAFMFVKKLAKRSKAAFSARNTDASGRVVLDAKRVASSATYYWELSGDQVNWSTVPETMQASTVISGLTAGKVYYFRFRALTRKGKGDYSQIVSLMVL